MTYELNTAAPIDPATGHAITEREADEARKMQPFLLKGFQADYIPAVWPGENGSGLIPYGPNVLVKMDACSNTSKGGIIMVDERLDRMNEASITGVVFAVGAGAFIGDASAPGAGDRVYIEKYAGIKAIGMDGDIYRIIDEKLIGAKITDEFRALLENAA